MYLLIYFIVKLHHYLVDNAGLGVGAEVDEVLELAVADLQGHEVGHALHHRVQRRSLE